MAAAPTPPGWVYILTNKAMPGLVKIGLTTRDLEEWAAELLGATGVPLPFVVAWGAGGVGLRLCGKDRPPDAWQKAGERQAGIRPLRCGDGAAGD